MAARHAVSKRIIGFGLSALMLGTVVLPAFDSLFHTETTQVLRPAVAGATPTVQSRQEQVRQVAREVEELDRRLDIASDDYNEAHAAYTAAVERRQEADTRLEETQQRLETIQLHLNTRATEVYRSNTAGAGILEVLLGATSFEEFAGLWQLLDELNRSDAASSTELKDLREEISALRDELIQIEATAKEQNDRMLAARQQAETDLANRRERLRGLEAEVRELQRQQAEAEARAAAERASSPTFTGGGQTFPPPSRQPRSEVVNIARRYLGVPYRWGGSSPQTGFDCSGFTSYVFRQVGVSLPRVSRAQINAGQRISRADIKPGDLVFFGSPIHHVGIYIGGGQMIHSPRTGDVVRVAPAFRNNFVGASRP
ncbi:MAG: NlpC/P60 family protein [Coriobacteriia bacterium]|nr:NlpC/P60 family protein [Coriobacteriia bacterium]MCL2536720.1 NlpC/P60 family protein [Coriobacteriia bacterium]